MLRPLLAAVAFVAILGCAWIAILIVLDVADDYRSN